MQLCMMIPPAEDRRWALARQMGVTRAIAKLAPELTGRAPPWDAAALEAARARYRAGGFEIVGLEGDQLDMSRIKLGLPGRDEDIERYGAMLRNMGRAGIRLLCLNFMAGTGWFRTGTDLPGRGGARVSGFDAAEAGGPTELGEIPAERIWENFAYFIDRVAPVAEREGVRLALHPDDPPTPALRGIGRVLNSVGALERAVALSASPAVGVTFCQGSIAAMGADVFEAARRLAPHIAFVHVRDIRRTRTASSRPFPTRARPTRRRCSASMPSWASLARSAPTTRRRWRATG